MRRLMERLRSGEVLLVDGALGTMLIARGLAPGRCPESINLERPQWLVEIARAYREAGADVLTANTFGGSPLSLERYGLAEDTEAIQRAAIRATREAAGDEAFIAVSCGPSGRLMKPYGDTEPDEVSDSFRRQLRAIAAAGVDLIAIETMTDLDEAVLAVQAAREVASGVPISATLTFEDTPRGFFTIMGHDIEQAAARLAEAGADIIGSNCGQGIETMLRITAGFQEHSSLPLIVQPNAGLPQTRASEVIYPESPEFMAQRLPALLDAGASIIGGCCGTTPAHTAAFRRVLDDHIR
ncbi:MAG: homocysteine S-methyltransferase family protein [Acidobacteriota bacterium]|nr:MAG: homocysteine S-methyltransferase family protein [Acidobacteriota bacterium]